MNLEDNTYRVSLVCITVLCINCVIKGLYSTNSTTIAATICSLNNEIDNIRVERHCPEDEGRQVHQLIGTCATLQQETQTTRQI